MTGFFALVIVWAIITLVGHGSWVLTSRLYRWMVGAPRNSPLPLTDDREVFNRVLDQLHARGFIDQDEAATLWNQASQLDRPTALQQAPTMPAVEQPYPTGAKIYRDDLPLIVATIADQPQLSFSDPLTDTTAATVPQGTLKVTPTTSMPLRSLAAIIQSFLALHNIRWGELIAGLLIVVCSIGLVISLWSTLVNAHRIVPTLVFLFANAAIFAAGFYTLAKWRLRHTSRAVLMIASLLVPLSVLAGLATASQSRDSVSLSDPVTLLAILFGTAVNVMLLLRAGRALYGATKGQAFALAVAAPTALIPLIPAALRMANASAGFLVAPASLAVALAILWFQRPWLHKLSSRRYLTAVSRHQWTFLSVSAFSLVTLAMAISLLGRGFKPDLWLIVVTSCLPALIAVGVAAHWTSIRTNSQSHRFVGTVVSVLVGSLLLVMLPLFSHDPKWLWLYSGVASGSCLALWTVYRRAPWLAIAFAPVGIAAVLSSTSMLQQIDWDSISWTRRLIGGEPMLACLALASLSCVVLSVLRKSEHKQSLSLLSVFWLAWASIDAVVLAFAPESWRGVVPEWALVSVLVVLTIVSAAAALLVGVPATISIVFACVVSHSLFPPFTLPWGGGGQIADETVWLNAFTSAVCILTMLSVLAARFLSPQVVNALKTHDLSVDESTVIRISRQWFNATAALAFLSLSAAVIAIADRSLLVHQTSTVVVTICFLVVATALFLLSNRADSALRAAFAAAVVAPASSLWIAAFYDIHIVTWIQLTAIAALAWAELARTVECFASPYLQSDRIKPLALRLRTALTNPVTVALAIGYVSAVGVIVEPLIGINRLGQFVDPVCLLVSFAAVAYALVHGIPINRSQTDDGRIRLAWPVGFSLLTGQCVWLVERVFPRITLDPVVILFSLLTFAAIASLVRFARLRQSIDLWHVLVLSIFSLFATEMSTNLSAGFVLVLLTLTGIVATMKWSDPASRSLSEWSLRMVIWYVVIAQGWTLARIQNSTGEFELAWTFVVLCNSLWIVGCNLLLRPESRDQHRRRLLPELAILAALLVVVELSFHFDDLTSIDTKLFAIRYGFLLASVIAVWIRANTWQQLTIPICLAVALLAVLAMQIGGLAKLTQAEILAAVVLTTAIASALLAFHFPFVARLHRGAATTIGLDASGNIGSHAVAVLGPLTIAAVVATIAAIRLMILDEANSMTSLTIAGVAISAFGVGEVSERLNRTSLQRFAIGLGLLAIYLWASMPSFHEAHPILGGTMRWLVASVWLIPTLLWGVPRTLGGAWAGRWRETLQLAASTAAAIGTGSLVAMLCQELVLRTSAGIPNLPLVLVIGVALTIGVLSLIAAVVALGSGPALNLGSRWTAVTDLQLQPLQRRALIIAAQILGALAWLHVFLCNPEFGLVGLRAYWPYLVLLLAFVSVGLVEWARRRGDEVIAETLKQTSLFLPLIPIVGMLLSGTWSKPMLGIVNDVPSLSFVLMIATGYYVMLSKLWHAWLPRVLMVVFANSAIWSLLAAQPGWGLLSHPQLWLIPPAVCVLFLAHRYRHQLDVKLAAGIRYGATLLIYVSSTADMLMQQIGTSLWGPIILILLALTGIVAGVLLRVRPFLYLGTVFVLMGVMSMVWHAQRSIDQVWPWWAFGITTGICLLSALMSIEKNKGKLKALSAKLAAWE